MANSFNVVERAQAHIGSCSMAALAGKPAHFVPDPRFTVERAAPLAEARVGVAAKPDAWQLGYAAGFSAAQVEEQSRFREEIETREKLQLAFARLDDCARRTLAKQLAETVAGLCDATLAPLALDRQALQQRCEAAAVVLGEARERLTLRLNSADIPQLDAGIAHTWAIVADDGLARGSLRLESENGGIADDPASWSEQLRLALRGC